MLINLSGRGRGPLLGALWEFTKRPYLFSGRMDVAEEQVQDLAVGTMELQRPFLSQQAKSVVPRAGPCPGKPGTLLHGMRTSR